MMTPEEKIQFDELKRKVDLMYRVQDISFIESIKRYAGTGIRTESSLSNSSILKTVLESGSATYSVAKAFDVKIPFYLSDGSRKFLGAYNS